MQEMIPPNKHPTIFSLLSGINHTSIYSNHIECQLVFCAKHIHILVRYFYCLPEWWGEQTDRRM